MRLWIVSDIHWELTRGWDLPSLAQRPAFDVLIVAGDLVPQMERGVQWLAQRVTDRRVLYVGGNHEFFGTDIDRTVDKARQAAVGTTVTVLQNDAIYVGDTLFLGATLWTDFSVFGNREYAMMRAGESMNDYKKIRKRDYSRRLRLADTLARHRESCEFIARSVRESNMPRKVVVITHHGPIRQAMRAGSEHDVLSAAYVSDRPDLLQGVDVWVYGHMHETRDFTVSSTRTRMVTNCKGYGPWKPTQTSWDNAAFDPRFIIEI